MRVGRKPVNDDVRDWLENSLEGRILLRRTFEKACWNCKRPQRFQRVLAVLQRVGDLPGVAIYHDDRVLLRTIELPDISDDCWDLRDRLIESMLPRFWRDMPHFSERKIAREVFRGLPVSVVREFRETLGLIREIRDERAG